jgi:hypothetical protein
MSRKRWLTLAEVREQLRQEAHLKACFESMSFTDQAVSVTRLIELGCRRARLGISQQEPV